MTLSHSGASELNQLMEGTTVGALIPEIVRRGFQDLLEFEVSALIGAQLHERCPDQHSTHRNGYRRRLLTTQVVDLTLAIPKLRHGSFFPDWLEPRRRVDKALYAVIMEAFTGGISTHKVDALVEALGGDSGTRQVPGGTACRRPRTGWWWGLLGDGAHAAWSGWWDCAASARGLVCGLAKCSGCQGSGPCCSLWLCLGGSGFGRGSGADGPVAWLPSSILSSRASSSSTWLS